MNSDFSEKMSRLIVNGHKAWMNVTWDDAPHLDPQAQEALMASYEEHERDTRTKGLPMMGSGLIYPVRDSEIAIDPIPAPDHWALGSGCDFGIDHPGAGVKCAYDRDSDVFYVTDCYKKSGETAIYHAAWFKDWGPVAWPKDGFQRDKGDGTAIKRKYREAGAPMMKDYAHYKDERGVSVEAGLQEMLQYMRTSKFKVFRHLQPWFVEKAMYHRKDGQVVKVADDIMAATRYAFVMRRKFRSKTEMGARSRVLPPPRSQAA